MTAAFLRLIRDLEAFSDELKTLPLPHLLELRDRVNREIGMRNVWSGVVEPFTPDEMKMDKLEAVRSYKLRTGCSLQVALDAWRKTLVEESRR